VWLLFLNSQGVSLCLTSIWGRLGLLVLINIGQILKNITDNSEYRRLLIVSSHSMLCILFDIDFVSQLMNTKMEARNCMFNAVVVITWCFMLKVGVSDPGINMLSQGCSTYNVSSVPNFNSNLNITFGLVRTDLMNSSKKFVTEQSLSGPDSVYAMFQCRDYMSAADCIACFSAASTQIRNCSVANGARVVYDGCFLRYFPGSCKLS